ncbi:MAG TPA: hypothetical protein VGG74_26310 [Kofleriaceae bacterium]|jgi:hypothetical protein
MVDVVTAQRPKRQWGKRVPLRLTRARHRVLKASRRAANICCNDRRVQVRLVDDMTSALERELGHGFEVIAAEELWPVLEQQGLRVRPLKITVEAHGAPVKGGRCQPCWDLVLHPKERE